MPIYSSVEAPKLAGQVGFIISSGAKGELVLGLNLGFQEGDKAQFLLDEVAHKLKAKDIGLTPRPAYPGDNSAHQKTLRLQFTPPKSLLGGLFGQTPAREMDGYEKKGRKLAQALAEVIRGVERDETVVGELSQRFPAAVEERSPPVQGEGRNPERGR